METRCWCWSRNRSTAGEVLCSVCTCDFLQVCVLPRFLTFLSVFTLNGDVVTVTTPSDCRWLQVDFQPPGGGEEGEKEEERRKIKVPATGNMVSNFGAAVFTAWFMSLCPFSIML